ncbi:MAG TPA: IS91 family transposase [Streptosporangiaceae bacterium]|nr:IS91 family transposase [Streptosporangiaceae bacterium]
MRPPLEVADIFRVHGPAWRAAHAGRMSLAQLKVMSAIEACRTAALGGHVEGCEDCGHHRIAYNSCRNRHCPKCQGAAAREWLAAREADLLPVGYFHVVFTVPAEIADIGFHNKAVVYDLLFRVASETMLTIAADPRHLGARIGITAVLHTWGSAMTHHPHIHMIVPGGGISLDGERWVSSRAGFLLPVRVLAKLFRRLFLAKLLQLHAADRLQFFGDHAGLSDRRAFLRHLAPLRTKTWVVYAKPPFAGPEAVLAYLSRYTHRVAISNRRLIALDETGVTFRYKDYRRGGPERQRTMTLSPAEFIRRFLLHVLPKGFHRIRHYGLLASAGHKVNVARARALLDAPAPAEPEEPDPAPEPRPPCPCCGGRMVVIEIFPGTPQPRAPPSSPFSPGKMAS